MNVKYICETPHPYLKKIIAYQYEGNQVNLRYRILKANSKHGNPDKISTHVLILWIY